MRAPAPVRARFSPEKPFPERGIVSPDVFPSPMQGRHGRVDLHDTLQGSIPRALAGQKPRQGWLRVAMGNGADLDYASPHLTEGERKLRMGNQRKTVDIYLRVAETEVIKRTFLKLNKDRLELPAFDGEAFTFLNHPDLLQETPIEQAIAFRGTAEVKGSDVTPVSGIHFDSGEENGWILLGEPPAPTDPAPAAA